MHVRREITVSSSAPPTMMEHPPVLVRVATLLIKMDSPARVWTSDELL